jgi:hypothetical protein
MENNMASGYDSLSGLRINPYLMGERHDKAT